MPKATKWKKVRDPKLHWWSQLTVKGQRAYIKAHPNSMYARLFKPKPKIKWSAKKAKQEAEKAKAQTTNKLIIARLALTKRMGAEHKAGNTHKVIELQNKHDIVSRELTRRNKE